MSARKRWRTTQWPQYVATRHDSKAALYRWVGRIREERRLGMNRTQTVVVEVDEGDGWVLYERLHLDHSDSKASS